MCNVAVISFYFCNFAFETQSHKRMKKIFSFLIISLCSIVAFAQEQVDSLITPFCISDGHFFAKENFRDVMPGGSTIAPMRDPDGNKIIGVFLPDGFTLDESVIAKAIPAEKVKYADKLLRDYNGRKPSVLNKYEGIGVEVGKPFINFNYKDTDNQIWNNQTVAGKVYVINVWQSECGPCRGEMPILSNWKKQFPNVVFLSASRHNTEEILPIVQRHNFTWTHLQEASDIVALVGQQGFPLTVVVDKNGIVRFAKVGASEENQTEAFNTIQELSK